MPAYNATHAVIHLEGNPQTTTLPFVLGVTNADIHDAGDGTWGYDVSTSEMEKGGASYTGSTSTYTIDGIVYNSTDEIDTGSIFIDGIQVQGYYVHLIEFNAGGAMLNQGAFFFPLAGEDVSFINPGVSIVTSTGQIDTNTPMPYAGLAGPMGVVCFGAGAKIKTPSGDTRVEALKVGQLVETICDGPKEIRWIGRRKEKAVGRFAPVMFTKDVLDNFEPLLVSQQHRMLVTGWQSEILFGETAILVAAKDLVNGDTIYIREGGYVEYFHIMFDQHQIIFANGAPSESFFLGELAVSNINPSERSTIFSMFPELQKTHSGYGNHIHPTAQSSVVKILDYTK